VRGVGRCFARTKKRMRLPRWGYAPPRNDKKTRHPEEWRSHDVRISLLKKEIATVVSLPRKGDSFIHVILRRNEISMGA